MSLARGARRSLIERIRSGEGFLGRTYFYVDKKRWGRSRRGTSFGWVLVDGDFVLISYPSKADGTYDGAVVSVNLLLSRHATERAFFRLNTLDVAAVFDEFESVVDVLSERRTLRGLLDALDAVSLSSTDVASFAFGTRTGVAVANFAFYPPDVTERGHLIGQSYALEVITWISKARLQDGPGRKGVIYRAFSERA